MLLLHYVGTVIQKLEIRRQNWTPSDFKKKLIDWHTWVEDCKRCMLDFIGRGEVWDVREGGQVGFESLDLTTERIE